MDNSVCDQEGNEICEGTDLNYYSKENGKLLQNANPQFKSAVLIASPSVVSVVSFDVPQEMIKCTVRGSKRRTLPKDQVYIGPGFVIESEKNDSDDKYSITILTSASLFLRTNNTQPSDIEVQVYLPNGDKCKGKVFACDFHYNLAALNVQLDSPVKPAKLRDLDDVMPIHVTDSDDSQTFQLRRHSRLFKIRPGDTVAAIARFTTSNFGVSFGEFSDMYPGVDCKELYSITSEDSDFQNLAGSPVINCLGEVIGILVARGAFLPSNIISKWWDYYKDRKMYCRPSLAINVANLHSANFNFLERLIRSFPDVSSGVIVTEVVENSSGYSSGLRRKDVIVQCDGATVGSILDLFDKIWDKIGSSVELSVLREKDQFNVNVAVIEPTSDCFHRWAIPPWTSRPGFGPDMSVYDPNSERYAYLRARQS